MARKTEPSSTNAACGLKVSQSRLSPLPCSTGRIGTVVMLTVLKAFVRWVGIFLEFPFPITPLTWMPPLCLSRLSFKLIPFHGNVRRKKREGCVSFFLPTAVSSLISPGSTYPKPTGQHSRLWIWTILADDSISDLPPGRNSELSEGCCNLAPPDKYLLVIIIHD